MELVVAACLLHDVASFDVLPDDNDHGRVSAEIARPLLNEVGYAPEQVENICISVAEHADVENPSSQLDFQIAFFRKFVEEHDASVLPELR